MVGRNSIVNMRKNFLKPMQKILPENSLPLPRNPKKVISLGYDAMTMFTPNQFYIFLQ